MVPKLKKLLLPPIIGLLYRRIFFRHNDDKLFEGDDELFKKLVSNSAVYGEYGCGSSTIWVSKNCSCRIYACDTSRYHLDRVRSVCSGRESTSLHWVDVGPLTHWGTPEGYSKRENFRDYGEWIWSQEKKPDVVLIDGRFRVYCFLVSLRNASQGTKIVFDDYKNRPYYHFVEKYVIPSTIHGRQAVFIVPNKRLLDFNELEQDINRFLFVFD